MRCCWRWCSVKARAGWLDLAGLKPSCSPLTAAGVILVDTSVWIDHLQQGDTELAAALEAVHVRVYPFVVGELACGNLRARAEVLGLLQALPSILVATDKEVFFFMAEKI